MGYVSLSFRFGFPVVGFARVLLPLLLPLFNCSTRRFFATPLDLMRVNTYCVRQHSGLTWVWVGDTWHLD
jgi:hypothetical protein